MEHALAAIEALQRCQRRRAARELMDVIVLDDPSTTPIHVVKKIHAARYAFR